MIEMNKRNNDTKRARFNDADFKKSNYSPAYPQIPFRCVLVAKKSDLVAVRDSKDPGKTTLVFTKEEWDAFVKDAKAGEFDL